MELQQNLKQLLATLSPGHRSQDFRRALRNASWSSTDYLVLPVLLLVATPYLVFHLGTEQYGIWMLVNALTGMTGLFSLGLGDATIKYVSSYRARADWAAITRVTRSTLTTYLLLGFATAGVVYLSAPFLVHRTFKIDPPSQLLAASVFRIGGIGLAVRFVNGVFLSVVQGYERYDLSSRVTIITKSLTIAVAVGLVALGFGVLEILWATLLLSGGGAIALALLAKSLLPGISFWPLLDRTALREVFGFGLYSWLQAIAGTVFAQADLVLIGILLGATPVAFYSICQRLAMQIHALLAAGSSFLFPMSSAATALGDVRRMRSIYLGALNVVTALAAAMGVPLFLFSKSILTHWMGSDFAQHASALLKVLTFGYALLATSIIPYNVLNGTGQVRINTLLGWTSVAVVVAATFLLVPPLGLVGVAWAKLANIIPLITAMAYVHRTVLFDRNWSAVLSHFVLLTSTFLIALLVIKVYGDPKLTNLSALFAILGSCVVLTLGMSAVVQRIFNLAAASSQSSTG